MLLTVEDEVKVIESYVQYIFLQARQRDLYLGHFKILLSWKINDETTDVGRSGEGIVLGLTLMSIRSFVLFLNLTYSLATARQIFHLSF